MGYDSPEEDRDNDEQQTASFGITPGSHLQTYHQGKMKKARYRSYLFTWLASKDETKRRIHENDLPAACMFDCGLLVVREERKTFRNEKQAIQFAEKQTPKATFIGKYRRIRKRDKKKRRFSLFIFSAEFELKPQFSN